MSLVVGDRPARLHSIGQARPINLFTYKVNYINDEKEFLHVLSSVIASSCLRKNVILNQINVSVYTR